MTRRSPYTYPSTQKYLAKKKVPIENFLKENNIPCGWDGQAIIFVIKGCTGRYWVLKDWFTHKSPQDGRGFNNFKSQMDKLIRNTPQ